jgi:predicted aminopeptidase
MRKQKAGILERLAADVRTLEHQEGVHFYDSWLRDGLNNAHLASLATYYDCVPGFERLLAEQDGDLQRFYAAARELAERSRAARHEELCRPLPAD